MGPLEQTALRETRLGGEKGQDYRPLTTSLGLEKGLKLGGQASRSCFSEAPLSLPKRTLPRRSLSLCIRKMGTWVQLVGPWVPGRRPICSSPRHLSSQSESSRPCIPLSGGRPSQWRRTRWRAVATQPQGLGGPRNLLRAAWVWAARKPCLPTAATPQPPRRRRRLMTPAWGKARTVAAALWYGPCWPAWVEAGTAGSSA